MTTLGRPTYDDLANHGAFIERHIGPSPADQLKMLGVLGYSSLDELTSAAIPSSIERLGELSIGAPRSEVEVIAELREIASKNQSLVSLIGLGYYGTVTPPVVLRNVLENPAWYTAYTPYQPEISQGRLEAVLNFQTMIADLTGMDIANASMLDEGTAAAEAMALCHRLNPKAGEVFFIDADCFPQTIAVVATRAEPLGIALLVGDPETDIPSEGVFGVLLQYPGASGRLRDDSELIERIHAQGASVAVAADLLALSLIRPPGEIGADVVVGSSQRFGVPLGFGGPHAGFMAVRDSSKRSLPGRLVGVSVDSAGRPALRLALQTREQHIRREKATSNICTAQVLLAVIAGFYGVWHGPDGLKRIAQRIHRQTAAVAQALKSAGVVVLEDAFFDTLSIQVPGRAGEVIANALASGINLRHIDEDTIGLSLDEQTTPDVIESVLLAFGVSVDIAALLETVSDSIPAALIRTSDFMTHPVFSKYRSETLMLRYLRRLADLDLALDRTMIPLGSCTMKLNATTEMIPVTWPEFGAMHPFAPIDQSIGYRRLFKELEDALVEITGYDAVSLQPNAGSQGEFAGLLAIRAYHRSRGEFERTVCLIPASAHGTNAASAAMVGMTVVVVACNDSGDIDLEDLTRRIAEHAGRIGALMVTYPSTHGVFDTEITDVCAMVHDAGGQVYLDGANLNALVGLAAPGHFGADVSHLNLHKTFCIPHGGGGPGVGPVGVRSHLAEFLPSHPLVPECGPVGGGVGPISAAPWGSASLLPISWAYVAMMGGEGLRKATQVAILNANYIAHRLEEHFPVLYRGESGLVAHECIIDIRPITDATGVSVDDVAKRLVDYGFHSPTMSFPVSGTLMIEPTESEDLGEVDRFIDAMISIRSEIKDVEDGRIALDESALHNAPHTAADLMTGEWGRPYTREQAAYPTDATRRTKYWPPVSRIDGVYGDRNVFCSCPPLSDYEDQ
ncbi:MAG: aminomethyl-transferring glycine dehydrogenase [Actinobacteria bacterium]|uniref:glycine dehydrogenase (aminomethyl-transferring) n=2 Tax=freshwater metagenome TaxID=449393 RepID=A0A6J7P1X7_9ZZZZ|nr:aminomethyl-transferring glycine dehydrogenase [Actinomycetota bacterium]MSZ28734.1 aminomethyl-transferring glycine dehydrogenase [Actinomycetota bacterium]